VLNAAKTVPDNPTSWTQIPFFHELAQIEMIKNQHWRCTGRQIAELKDFAKQSPNRDGHAGE
jgi:hypothetical protein